MRGFVFHVGGRRPYRFAVTGQIEQKSTAILSDGRLIGRPVRIGDYVIGYSIKTDLVLESVNPIPRRVRRRLGRRPLGLLMADDVLFVPDKGAEWWFRVEDIYEDLTAEGQMRPLRTGRVRLSSFTVTTRSLRPEQIV